MRKLVVQALVGVVWLIVGECVATGVCDAGLGPSGSVGKRMTVARIMTCVMVRRVQAVRRDRMAGGSVAGYPMHMQSMCRETVKTR
jgi:hypothetical protein